MISFCFNPDVPTYFVYFPLPGDILSSQSVMVFLYTTGFLVTYIWHFLLNHFFISRRPLYSLINHTHCGCPYVIFHIPHTLRLPVFYKFHAYEQLNLQTYSFAPFKSIHHGCRFSFQKLPNFKTS